MHHENIGKVLMIDSSTFADDSRVVEKFLYILQVISQKN